MTELEKLETSVAWAIAEIEQLRYERDNALVISDFRRHAIQEIEYIMNAGSYADMSDLLDQVRGVINEWSPSTSTLKHDMAQSAMTRTRRE